MQASPRYDRRTIILHWATAFLVVAMWGSAQLIDDFPRGWQRVDARSVHITMGVALLVIFVWRVLHRMGSGRRLPAADKPLLHVAAKATHYALYLLIAAQLTLGLWYLWLRGDSIWNLFSIPQLPQTGRALRDQVGDLHNTVAYVILGVAGIHAIAALVHHYVWRDGVLRRMISDRSVP